MAFVRVMALCALASGVTVHAFRAGHVRPQVSPPRVKRRISAPRVTLLSEQQATTYEEAEKLGLALFTSGDYEAAIKQFEKAKSLPGAGYDVVRTTPGSQTPGDKSQPPNPRGLQEKRFASPAQIAIAEYNISCCLLKLGSKADALDRLRSFVESVDNPGRQFERMLKDPDLSDLRSDIENMRDEMATRNKWDPLAGIKKLLDVNFVEWK